MTDLEYARTIIERARAVGRAIHAETMRCVDILEEQSRKKAADDKEEEAVALLYAAVEILK